MNANRRSQERKQPGRMVFCKLGSEESSLVLDLSEDGLRFESLTPIEEKDLLELKLSVDVGGAIEATGKLAWIDSAKRTGGLRFLDLSAPAREQIRAWLSETSAASSGAKGCTSLQKRAKQVDDAAATEKPAIRQETSAPSTHLVPRTLISSTQLAPGTQLVPIEQYRKQTRAQFVRGVLVGFGICALVMIPIFLRHSGGKAGSSGLAAASAGRAAQSSGEQARTSVAQPVAPSAAISEPFAAKPLATHAAGVPTGSLAALTGARQRQSPPIAGASSTDFMMRASPSPGMPQAPKVRQAFGASPAVATAPAASNAHPSLGQAQRTKKGSATVQQLWAALQAGDINAAVALADLYARGEGVPMNCQQARVLLMAASEKNNAEAAKKLRELNKGGCPGNKE